VSVQRQRHAFDYVIVQVVPRVDRGERLNVGAILYCPAAAFLGCRFTRADARLKALAAELDLDAVAHQVEAIRAVCHGERDAGPIARLTPSERFHWLSAPRSTVVQPSEAHTGLCLDPAAALDDLFGSMIRTA
jgi:Protein of unknown function (DUF3037)